MESSTGFKIQRVAGFSPREASIGDFEPRLILIRFFNSSLGDYHADMSLATIRHQLTALQRLQRARSAQRIPHAYIFEGPDGVGRELLAREWAGVMLCNQPQREPHWHAEYQDSAADWLNRCGRCRSCELITSQAHPDYHLVYRQLNQFHAEAEVRKRKALEMSVDVIRQFVIAEAAKKPMLGRGKVFVIREAELLTTEAQNALLKTLEEPPPGTYLILITTSARALLPTTCSRAHPIPLGLLPEPFVIDHLQQHYPESPVEQLHLAARLQPGSVGQATRVLELGLWDYHLQLGQMLAELSRYDALEAASHLETLAAQLGKKLQQENDERSDSDIARQSTGLLLTLLAGWFRDLLCQQSGAKEIVHNQLSGNALSKIGSIWQCEQIPQVIRTISAAETSMDHNVNRRLMLDDLMIQLARQAPHK
ncbi:MAG: hypothetical protein HJJLKODD_01732 [Phycisphaerae bacterium]|nr:hypothetical protein [Phycisphaerae bacterium]